MSEQESTSDILLRTVNWVFKCWTPERVYKYLYAHNLNVSVVSLIFHSFSWQAFKTWGEGREERNKGRPGGKSQSGNNQKLSSYPFHPISQAHPKTFHSEFLLLYHECLIALIPQFQGIENPTIHFNIRSFKNPILGQIRDLRSLRQVHQGTYSSMFSWSVWYKFQSLGTRKIIVTLHWALVMCQTSFFFF